MVEDSDAVSGKDESTLTIDERRKTLGIALRELRENAGMSRQDLGHLTRISMHFIAALEEGNYADLPGEIFGRGFLRNILKALNAPSGTMVQEFDLCWKELQLATLRERSPSKLGGDYSGRALARKRSEKSVMRFVNFFSRKTLLMAGAGALALILMVWSAFRAMQPGNTQLAEDAKPSVTAQEEVIGAVASQEPAPSFTGESEEPSPLTNIAPETPSDAPAAPAEVAPEGTSMVRLTVLRPVKINRKGPEETYQSQEFQPGTYEFAVKDKVDFYIYDVRSVRIEFDDKPVTLSEALGAERKLTFVNRKGEPGREFGQAPDPHAEHLR